jgi:hypothetical protein
MLTALLLVAAAPNVTVETLGETRFRVTTVYATSGGPELIARAQFRLMEEAERVCRGRGRAVSEGSLEIHPAPDRPGRTALSEVYNCIAPVSR